MQETISPLLFFTSRHMSRHQIVYGGVSVDPPPDDALEGEGWNGFILGERLTPVRIVQHQVEIVHLSGHGWMIDGTLARDAQADSFGALAVQSPFGDLKLTPPRDHPLPFFVGSNSLLRPCRYDLHVRMHGSDLHDLPDERVRQGMTDTALNAWRADLDNCLAEARVNLRPMERKPPARESKPIAAGVVQPVAVGDAHVGMRAVLHLVAMKRENTFRATLYASDRDDSIKAGAMLCRRAQWIGKTQTIRHEAIIATIISVESVTPLLPEQPGRGIVRTERDGVADSIVCMSCGARFAPAAFSDEQREVIDLWGWLSPVERERQILSRAQDFYRRHPEARGRVVSRFRAIRNDPASFSLENINKPFDEMRDPRPADYQQKLKTWTADDLELREFFENVECDVDRRMEFVSEKARELEVKLSNRCVICPVCNDGIVGLSGGRPGEGDPQRKREAT